MYLECKLQTLYVLGHGDGAGCCNDGSSSKEDDTLDLTELTDIMAGRADYPGVDAAIFTNVTPGVRDDLIRELGNRAVKMSPKYQRLLEKYKHLKENSEALNE